MHIHLYRPVAVGGGMRTHPVVPKCPKWSTIWNIVLLITILNVMKLDTDGLKMHNF